MSQTAIERTNPREEKIILERVEQLLKPHGITPVLTERYASMDILLVDTTTRKCICCIEIETKPQKYSFGEYYPSPHPLWVTTPAHSDRGWSFLYRKIMKLTKDPRGRYLVHPKDLYVICDQTCDKLFVATFGDIRVNCKLVQFNPNNYRSWYYRYPARPGETPSFIRVDGNGYGFIVKHALEIIKNQRE